MGRQEDHPGSSATRRQRDRKAWVESKGPMTAGELSEALAKFPADTPLFIGIGGNATTVDRVRWGNEYSLPGSREFLTVESSHV